MRHEPPETADTPGGGPVATAVGFARELRRVGLEADVGAVIDYARALSIVDLAAADDVRHTGAALFVRRPEQLAVYDDAFDRFWLRDRRRRSIPEPSHGGADEETGKPQPSKRPPGVGGGEEGAETQTGFEPLDDAGDGASDAEEGSLSYSAAEVLRAKSFE
jgi:uncharacterized protein with von Willebrand factor type A (vWA) domain